MSRKSSDPSWVHGYLIILRLGESIMALVPSKTDKSGAKWVRVSDISKGHVFKFRSVRKAVLREAEWTDERGALAYPVKVTPLTRQKMCDPDIFINLVDLKREMLAKFT